jgi:hypothetical protein
LDLIDPLFTRTQRCSAGMHRVFSEHKAVSVRGSVIGPRAPEKERQPRSQFEIVQPDDPNSVL